MIKRNIILILLTAAIGLSACGGNTAVPETPPPESASPAVVAAAPESAAPEEVTAEPAQEEIHEPKPPYWHSFNWELAAEVAYQDGKICYHGDYGLAIFNGDGVITKYFDMGNETSGLESRSDIPRTRLDMHVYGEYLVFQNGRGSTSFISLLNGLEEEANASEGTFYLQDCVILSDYSYYGPVQGEPDKKYMWVKAFSDGKFTDEYIIPYELLPPIDIFLKDGEYRPEEGLLAVSCAMYDYTINLADGAVTREDSYKAGPDWDDVLPLGQTTDGLYSVFTISGGRSGSILYSVDNASGKTRDYGIWEGFMSLVGHKMALTAYEKSTCFYDLETGALLDLSLPPVAEEDTYMALVYDPGSESYLRAVGPTNKYNEHGNHTPPQHIRVDFFSTDGVPVKSVQTPFVVKYGKMSSTYDAFLTVCDGKALMREYIQFENIYYHPYYKVCCLDIATGECGYLEGEVFFALGDTIFTVDTVPNTKEAVIRLYDGDVLLREKQIEHELFFDQDLVRDLRLTDYDPETGLLEGEYYTNYNPETGTLRGEYRYMPIVLDFG
jgi:hypothetical protein